MGLGQNPSTPAQAAGKVYKVDFLFTGYAYPYFAPMAQGVRQAAKHYPNLSIKIINANNSGPTESSQLATAVAAGVQGIILNPDRRNPAHRSLQVREVGSRTQEES